MEGEETLWARVVPPAEVRVEGRQEVTRAGPRQAGNAEAELVVVPIVLGNREAAMGSEKLKSKIFLLKL